jgi:predicted aconitase with swiveling domain
MKIHGRKISSGKAKGKALVTGQAITFLGGVDPDTGIVVESGHEIEGESVSGKILVFPRGKGSTVGVYTIYGMKKKGTAPAGIINVKSEQVIATGAIISEIPMLDSLEENPIKAINTGDSVKINADEGYAEVEK